MSDSNEEVSGSGEALKSASPVPGAVPDVTVAGAGGTAGAELDKLAIDESSYDSLEREFQVRLHCGLEETRIEM